MPDGELRSSPSPSLLSTFPANARKIGMEIEAWTRQVPTLDQFKQEIRTTVLRLIRSVGANGVVVSLSGTAGYWIAIEAGIEMLWSPSFGWACFAQGGIGLSTPGAGVALEVGLLWDIEKPSDYKGLYLEGAFTFGPGTIDGAPGMVSISGSMTPEDVGHLLHINDLHSKHNPRVLKVGGGYGTPGAQGSLVLEDYVQVHPESWFGWFWKLLQAAR